MLAASLDLSSGCGGLILEKTASIGTKLLMSGGGRCNITHGGSIKDFIGCYSDAGPRLRKCLYRHSNLELARWLEDSGVDIADERGELISTEGGLDGYGRIFPASMKASEILDLLVSKAKANGWSIRTEAEVVDLSLSESGLWSVLSAPSERFESRHVVIATGGITFPETGSDGSMFDILRDFGVSVTPVRSALAPIYVEDYPYEELSGISVPGVTVSIPESKERLTGDILFTHRGFSGPVILNISRYAHAGSLMVISYNKASDDLPKRLLKALEERAKGPSGDVRTTVLSKLLESDEFTVTSVDENGMVTAGGISLEEIDTQSMRITKLCSERGDITSSVYAIGEALDADGITGGYNLQMCWSTARAAADHIRQQL